MTETPKPAEGRMTSQGFGHHTVKLETYKGETIDIRATPPTRFGVLYYIAPDTLQAWASIEAAIAEAKKRIDTTRPTPAKPEPAS